MPRLIDVFLYNGEIDLLRFRLAELAPLRAMHVIVEGAYTFTNQWRGLDLPSRLEQELAPYRDRIIYLPILHYPSDLSEGAWARERYLRNYPRSYLATYFSAQDYALVTDLDEVPNPTVLQPYLQTQPRGITALSMDMYYYSFRWQKPIPWTKAYLTTLASLPTDLDHTRIGAKDSILDNAGWHLSFFLTVPEIQRKLRSFSHTEYSGSAYTDSAHITQAIETGQDLFGRQWAAECLYPRPANATLPLRQELLPPAFRAQ